MTDEPTEPILQDETTISEITIGPDGRVFTFGTSRAVVEILHTLRPDDAKVGEILERIRRIDADPPPT